MKKKIAFLLVLVMTLSMIVLPTVSAEENESTVAPVAFYVQGKTVTVDGDMNDTEGYGKPAYQMELHVRATKSADSTGSPNASNLIAASTYATPSTARFSYDNENLYIYYVTENPDTLAAANTSNHASYTPGESIIFRVMPKDCETMVYNETTNPITANGETVHIRIALDSSLASLTPASATDTSKTYYWKGINNPADPNADPENPAPSLVSEFFADSASTIAYVGTDIYNNTEVAVKVLYDAEGKATQKAVEVKLPLAEKYKTDLSDDGEADIAISMFEKSRYWMKGQTYAGDGGYVIAKDTYNANGTLSVPLTLSPLATNMMNWVESSKTTANHENLKNISVYVLGDDYLIGGALKDSYNWLELMNMKYTWEIDNLSEANASICANNDFAKSPYSTSISIMLDEAPDLIIVSGGLNDFAKGTPVGTIDDTASNTYMGALNNVIKELRKKYPDACIVFSTVYNFQGSPEGSTLTSKDYADAMKAVCEARQVYCFNAYDTGVSGINVSDATFRTTYCQTADDSVNLNIEGMKIIMPKYEAFISASMTDWAENKTAILENQKSFLAEASNNNANNNASNSSNETNNGKSENDTSANANAVPTAPVEEKKGCGSMIVETGLAMIALVACFGMVCLKKRKA